MKKKERYIVDSKWSGMLLGDILRKQLQYSRRSVIALKKIGGMTINGMKCHVNMVLKENDVIEIEFQDEESENILPEQMPLDIIFEDESLIVLNKAAGMPVHPTRSHLTGTLANGLANYWLGGEAAIKIRPINRLDKDTSGLVVFAKQARVQHLLSFFVGKEEFKKEYVAVVQGQMQQRAGTIDLPIARESEYAMRRVIREDGDKAVTHFNTAAVYEDYSVVYVTLETGRTHQIRVHFSHLGHPLLGDVLYGGNTSLIARQALHAARITMLHPITKQWQVFEAELPTDIRMLI